MGRISLLFAYVYGYYFYLPCDTELGNHDGGTIFRDLTHENCKSMQDVNKCFNGNTCA